MFKQFQRISSHFFSLDCDDLDSLLLSATKVYRVNDFLERFENLGSNKKQLQNGSTTMMYDSG